MGLKCKIIVLLTFGVFLFHNLKSQNFADKEFYMVDSLIIDSLSTQDKLLIDSILPFYHKAKQDTLKLSYLNKITEECYDDNVWPKYNRLLFDEAREVLSNPLLSKKEKKEIKRYIAAAINNFGYLAYSYGNYDEAIKHYQESLKYYQGALDKSGMATCFNNIAAIYDDQGNSLKALEYYKKSLSFVQKLKDKNGIALALNNIGYTYSEQGRIAEALENYSKSVRLLEEVGNEQVLATTFNNIAYIYKLQKDYTNSSKYYYKSLKIFERLGDKYGVAGVYNNLGWIYTSKNSQKALSYYERSLEIQKELKHQKGVADALNNIGAIYIKSKDFNKALEYFNSSLEIRKDIGEIQGVASSLLSIASLNKSKGNIGEAKRYALESMKISKEIRSPINTKNAAELLYQIYNIENNSVDELKMFQLYISMRDSISNESTRKSAIKHEIQYEFDKQALKDSLKGVETQRIKDLKHSQELDKQKTYVVGGGITVGLMVLVLIVIFRGYQIKRRSNIVLEEKNYVIEQKNKEITDSITYAERIQKAIIPPAEELNIHLKNSFVMYRPKDIVAGDFYWLQCIDDIVLYAAADCTGHGVPGAMVSVVCHNALNRAVREYDLKEPAQILNKTKEIVVETLKHSSNDKFHIKDGMDIALCSINFKTNELQYAGANNSLYIVNPNRKVALENARLFGEKNEGYEIKADKQPVAKHFKNELFTNHKIKLEQGDTIYTFSDGYPDQFGGEKGKKFMYKQFKQMLIAAYDLSLEKQLELIEGTFDEWKGTMEQVDDVCVIGVKV